MNNLLWLAIVLVVIWVVASVTKFVVGALVHLLLALAVVLLVIWVIKKIF